MNTKPLARWVQVHTVQFLRFLHSIRVPIHPHFDQVKEKKSGQIVALKTIELEEGESMEDALVEIRVLRDCDSPYVTKYINCYRQGFDKLYVVMELCEVGSVLGMLPKLHLSGFPEPTIAYIISGVLHGLDYLHKAHKMHRDIKACNVLCNSKGEVKLADFGITAMLAATWGRRNTFIGSPYWFASFSLCLC